MTRSYTSILGSELKACWHSDSLSAVGDGNPVSSWIDELHGYDFANGAGGTQPIWHADYLSSGYSSVKFDGVDDFLTLSENALNFAAGWTIFLLLRRTSSTAIQSVISNYTSASVYSRVRDQDTTYFLQDSGGFAGAVSVANTNDPAAVAFRYQSGRCTFFGQVSGSRDAVQVYPLSASTGTPVASDNWYLGKRGDASTQPYAGAISQVLIASHDIDTRDILETLTQMRYSGGIDDSDSEPVEPTGGGNPLKAFQHGYEIGRLGAV